MAMVDGRVKGGLKAKLGAPACTLLFHGLQLWRLQWPLFWNLSYIAVFHACIVGPRKLAHYYIT
jgi:hypothetical protein